MTNKIQIPIGSIVITFSVFMTVVLFVYFVLLRQELKSEKKEKMLGDNEQKNNAYSEKFNFLERQEVTASSLWVYVHLKWSLPIIYLI